MVESADEVAKHWSTGENLAHQIPFLWPRKVPKSEPLDIIQIYKTSTKLQVKTHHATQQYHTLRYNMIQCFYILPSIYMTLLCFITFACSVMIRYVKLHNASNYFSLWNLTHGIVISFVSTQHNTTYNVHHVHVLTLCLATHFTLHNLLLRYADSRYVSYPIISSSFSLQFNGLFFKPTFQKSWFIPYLCRLILWTSRHQLIIGWNCDRVNALQ